MLAALALPLALAACPGRTSPWSNIEHSERSAAIANRTRVDVYFDVAWPRELQLLPSGTRAVSFFVFRDEVFLVKTTAVRESGAETARSTVRLFPGSYIVRARAYGTDLPTDASPVLARGATSFTLAEGTEPVVAIDMVPWASPVPESPLDPSPTPTPKFPSGGGASPGESSEPGGIDLTVN